MVVAKSIAPSFFRARAGAAQLVEHLEVVQKGQFGVDGEGVHLPAPGSDGDLPLLIGQRFRFEELRDALAALDLDEKRPLALGREGERECGGDRGLAGPALAADDLEPAHVFEPNQSARTTRQAVDDATAEQRGAQRLKSAA